MRKGAYRSGINLLFCARSRARLTCTHHTTRVFPLIAQYKRQVDDPVITRRSRSAIGCGSHAGQLEDV